MTPEETTRFLRDAHHQPIDEAHFAAVRARVLADIQARPGRPASQRWIWLCALPALAAAVMLFLAQVRSPTRVAAPQVSQAPFDALRAVANEARRMPDWLTPISNKNAAAPAQAARSRSSGRVRAASVGRITALHPASLHSASAYSVVGPPKLQPLVVKLVTDDPSVVIYWISQGSGE
jgi:hypothetical protein